MCRLQATTKNSNTAILDLQYADDAAFPSHASASLQGNLDVMNESYRSAELVINARKTEVLCQPLLDAELELVVDFSVGPYGIRTV